MAALPAVLRLRPLAVPKVWGGSRLGASNAAAEPVGESWQVYDRGARRSSPILNTELGSATLAELVERFPDALLGRARADARGRFPLLLKLLEARSALSLQVHPDREAVGELALDDEPKSEAWVVLDASPGARLVCGLAEGREPAELCAALRDGADPEPFLSWVEVAPGDAFYLPAGTVHCAGGGLFLYEIQDNSELTLRLSDWGRLGPGGVPRALQLAEAERSVRSGGAPRRREPERPGGGLELLVECPSFRLYRLLPERRTVCETRSVPWLVTLTAGSARVGARGESGELGALESCLVPAEVEAFELVPAGGSPSILLACPEVA